MILHPAVKAVILQVNRFLVIRQTIKGKDIWDLPGGKVEYQEDPYQTLHREIKEETALEVDILKPLGMFWFIRKTDSHQVICTTFLCKPKNTDVDITKNPANENIVEYRWVTKEEFLSNDYHLDLYNLKELIQDL